MKITQIASTLGEMWKKLPEDEKAVGSGRSDDGVAVQREARADEGGVRSCDQGVLRDAS